MTSPRRVVTISLAEYRRLTAPWWQRLLARFWPGWNWDDLDD